MKIVSFTTEEEPAKVLKALSKLTISEISIGNEQIPEEEEVFNVKN